jgi:hypothetical protein
MAGAEFWAHSSSKLYCPGHFIAVGGYSGQIILLKKSKNNSYERNYASYYHCMITVRLPLEQQIKTLP